MTIMVTFCITTLPDSKILRTGSPSSFAMRMPIPISSEKMIRGRTFTSAMTWTGLEGTISRIIFCTVTASSCRDCARSKAAASKSIDAASSPAPGCKNVPMARPSQTAICPVTTNSKSARQPTLPSLRRSPILATPATKLKKIRGTTNILIKAIKISPIIFTS